MYQDVSAFNADNEKGYRRTGGGNYCARASSAAYERLTAAALGDVDVQYVWRFLRAQNIDLAARKSWCESNDPDFAAKAAEIVGLYLDPPENALVLAVDEKPSIQALERRQGYLKLANGRALTGQSHDYKRHGTTTRLRRRASSSGPKSPQSPAFDATAS